jgi:hypothetical protein
MNDLGRLHWGVLALLVALAVASAGCRLSSKDLWKAISHLLYCE